MSAAETRTITRADEPIDPRYMRMYMSAIRQELNRWGRWIEAHGDYEGFPGVNVLVTYLYGPGGGNVGHRILCLDMPVDVYATHARVLRCTEEQQFALWLWFVIRVKDDGTEWGLVEKAERAGVDPVQLRTLVNGAMNRILGIS